MKKTTKRLTINSETVRKLGEQDLALVNGGYTTVIYCDRTAINTCPPKTPDCPR